MGSHARNESRHTNTPFSGRMPPVLTGSGVRPPPPWWKPPVSPVTRIQSPIKEKTQKTPFSKITEYTDTSVYYILYFPYFPVPQPVEKCIQFQLIQTEYTARIGEYKAAFVYDSVTIRLGCIQSDSLGASTATPARHTP